MRKYCASRGNGIFVRKRSAKCKPWDQPCVELTVCILTAFHVVLHRVDNRAFSRRSSPPANPRYRRSGPPCAVSREPNSVALGLFYTPHWLEWLRLQRRLSRED
jgi:hypothetical protein